MIRLDHLTLPCARLSGRETGTRQLGLKVEFEIAERKTVALQDDSGFTLFLVESEPTSRLHAHVPGGRRRGKAPRALLTRRGIRERAAEALLGLRRRASRPGRVSHLSLG